MTVAVSRWRDVHKQDLALVALADRREGRRLLRVTESALARWLQNREQVECRLHEDSGERKAEAASFGA